ncbi:MAG: hypothetical protein AB3N16_04890, partial [Flavobacteriaceae bacterium]
MMKVNRFFKHSGLLMGLSFLLINLSCSTDSDDPMNADQNVEASEVKVVLEMDDLGSVADNALSSLYLNKGGQSGKASECYTAEYSETGFVATFTDCTLNNQDHVNGTVTVVYSQEAGSFAYTATYTNFSVNGIGINGTRSFELTSGENQQQVSFDVESQMTITYTDGTVVTESGSRSFSFSFGSSLATSTMSIEGYWTVKKGADTYKATITSALKGNFSCEHLVEGTMDLEKNGLRVSVDFGDGTCD